MKKYDMTLLDHYETTFEVKVELSDFDVVVYGEYEHGEAATPPRFDSATCGMIDSGSPGYAGEFSTTEYFIIAEDGSLEQTTDEAITGQIDDEDIYQFIANEIKEQDDE